MAKPDLKVFLSDPQFQNDRDFLDGYFQNFLERKAQEAAEKKKLDEPKSIFDVMFGE